MKTLRAVMEVTIYDDENDRKVIYRAEENELYWDQKLDTVRIGVVRLVLPESWKEV